jgi:RNA polymerase sigma-70 factor (ECF subfamily)
MEGSEARRRARASGRPAEAGVQVVAGDSSCYSGVSPVKFMADATMLGELAGTPEVLGGEAAVVAELKAGSEEAYAWLIARFHQPVYSLVYRLVNDPADAADTTQDVFLKVFRGMRSFHGQSSLKTWIYRIAVHEASNRRRWWFRHKRQERSLEGAAGSEEFAPALGDTLVDEAPSPLESAQQEELRARVEEELRNIPEPYRTTVMLRDIEELSYEEVAEVMQTTLGTVKSRLMRGRQALRKRLERYARESGADFGLKALASSRPERAETLPHTQIEVTP